MRLSKIPIALLLALLVGNAVVLFGTSELWDWPRFLAALALTFVLPGWAWLPVLGWLQTEEFIERLALIVGLSSLLSSLVLLFTVLLPGPFTETPTLLALNLLTLAGLLLSIIRCRLPTTNYQLPLSLHFPSRTVLLILLAIIAVAAVTRLTRLGYAEFHEDELENMRLIIRAYKGEEYAPFLDSKGPIHWLLPAALWYLNGWLNEGIARAPFALTALLLAPMMYSLGKRMSGRDSVGLAAAGFVALNGFYVALARHVENRSLIVFWGALAIWLAYRYYKENLPALLPVLALTLAVGLIAHPTVLLFLPAAAYLLIVKLVKDKIARRQARGWLIGAGVILGGLLALFYVPYITDPNIARTYEYFAGERVGESLLYNRVDNMLGEDALYSSRFHAPVLIFLLGWLLIRQLAQWRWPGWTLLGLLGLLIVSTVVWPEVWVAGQVNIAFIPYALLTLLVLLLPRTSVEVKTAFIWFAGPFGALLFLAQDASNHIQIAYTGWSLLAAFALVDLWAGLAGLTGPWRPVGRAVRAMLVLVLSPIILLILYYQYFSFTAPVTTYWQIKAEAETNPNSLYTRLYRSIPRPRKVISNPRLGGWKAVGYLWETGGLSGDFRSINESFAVPIWYTFQTPRSCYEDPQHYWLQRDWDEWPDQTQDLLDYGYRLTRVVLVDQEPKLRLYEKNAPPGEPEIIDSEAYRAKFDRLATPARFAREHTGQQATAFNFGGDRLRLIGYDLPGKSFQPGELIPITVYWESLAPMAVRYRGFMHLVGPDGALWGQHDDDPACRLMTTEMRPGQRASRQFRLPVAPEALPGEYQVVFGLYDPTTGERLGIWDAQAGQPAGDSLILGKVKIESPDVDLSAN